MANQLTRAERILWRSIEIQLESPAIGEIARGKLRGQLQAIRDGALVRQQQRAQCAKQAKAKKRGGKNAQPTIVPYPADRFARRQAILAGVMFSAPTREDQTDESWEKIMASYRLDLAAAACYRKLNAPKTSMSGHQSAERELLKIAKRRRELPEHESEPRPEPRPESVSASADPESLPDLTTLSDKALRARFALEKCFENATLVAALEFEIVRRKLPRTWRVEGTDLHVSEHGHVIPMVRDEVFMGPTNLPEDHPVWQSPLVIRALSMRRSNEERLKPTPTTAQSAYWNRGSKADVAPVVPVRDLKFIYQMRDGTRLWNTGEVLPQNEQLLRTTQVLAAPDPPGGYQQGSHVLPAEYVFNPAYFTWERKVVAREREATLRATPISISLNAEDVEAILTAFCRKQPAYYNSPFNRKNLVNCVLTALAAHKLTGFNIESIERCFVWLRDNGYFEHPVRHRGERATLEYPEYVPEEQEQPATPVVQRHQSEIPQEERQRLQSVDFETLKAAARAKFNWGKASNVR